MTKQCSYILRNNTFVSEKQIVIHTKNHTNQFVTYRSLGTTSYAYFLTKTTQTT